MQQVDFILYPKWIITVNNNDDVLTDHALVINNDKILEILPKDEAKQKYTSNQIKILADHAILPGFINCHTHNPMSLMRGIANDMPLMRWLTEYIFPTEKNYMNAEYIHDGMILAMAEMLKSGTTNFNEHYYFPIETSLAVEEVGMRATIGGHVIQFPTPWANGGEDSIKKSIEFFKQYQNHDLISIALAPHGPYTLADEDMIRIKDTSEEYKVKIHMHVHETADEVKMSLENYDKRPIKRMHDLGLMSPNFQCVHMTQITQEDLDILKETKPNIVHCPESNCKLASGIAPIQDFMDLGLTVALGTDGPVSNNDLDMIGEMRMANFISKLKTLNAETLPANKTLRMATINGAKILGLNNKIGSLEVGKQADCIAIDLNHVATQPTYDPIDQIVYASGRDQVTDVWVNGKQLLDNRKLTTIDEEKIIAKAQIWHEALKGVRSLLAQRGQVSTCDNFVGKLSQVET
ncbi:MAG: TRZ/ATZ family hydrolase [Gammaproteobacteria bacterium]|nr:TRZ/ATZ family hydrolase [Gammaproteobacteria bacterium]